ncbi:MAG: zinc ribbon domain-containing protein [Coriobacteriales bacterium]|jgi:hypothetical protein|nr:zinc ribbon domain-containing protein [Coriobacteriales bacterium]
MAFCGNCGTDAGDSNFCPACGTPVGVQAIPQEAVPAMQADDTPVYEFDGFKISNGKDVHVLIFPNRIEYTEEKNKAWRVTKAISTAGISLLAGKGKASETIPMKAVSHVSTKSAGLGKSKITITTSGGDIDFRVKHDEAEKVKGILLRYIL